MEDNEIIALFYKRDEKAIRLTEQKYSRYLYAIAHNILHDHEDSCECVNDTYLKAWNAIPPDTPPRLSLYLGKITRRLSIGRWRKNNAGKRVGTQYALSLDELEECVAASSSPEREADLDLIADIISRFLREQKEDVRTIFIRRYYFCDSIKYIARGEKISESKVKMTLMRTRERLREQLRKEGFDV